MQNAKFKIPLIVTAAIKPSAEVACRLCRGGAVKTEGQLSIFNCQFNILHYRMLSTCSLIFSNSSFIFTTNF